jgi:hypothetical protein
MNTITSFVKTALLITLHYDDGTTTTITRNAFEQWVDKGDHRLVTWPDATEDARLLTWQEYYAQEYVTGDLQAYIDAQERVSRIMEPLTEILSTYQPC